MRPAQSWDSAGHGTAAVGVASDKGSSIMRPSTAGQLTIKVPAQPSPAQSQTKNLGHEGGTGCLVYFVCTQSKRAFALNKANTCSACSVLWLHVVCHCHVALLGHLALACVTVCLRMYPEPCAAPDPWSIWCLALVASAPYRPCPAPCMLHHSSLRVVGSDYASAARLPVRPLSPAEPVLIFINLLQCPTQPDCTSDGCCRLLPEAGLSASAGCHTQAALSRPASLRPAGAKLRVGAGRFTHKGTRRACRHTAVGQWHCLAGLQHQMLRQAAPSGAAAAQRGSCRPPTGQTAAAWHSRQRTSAPPGCCGSTRRYGCIHCPVLDVMTAPVLHLSRLAAWLMLWSAPGTRHGVKLTFATWVARGWCMSRLGCVVGRQPSPCKSKD